MGRGVWGSRGRRVRADWVAWSPETRLQCAGLAQRGRGCGPELGRWTHDTCGQRELA